jgi:protein-disulfide isomerase
MTPIQEVERLVGPVTEADHIRGEPDASVTLVEYGEFECPHCGRAYHSIKELLEEAAGEIRFVFRHFARDDVHPFSERSAQAAEAAGAQGRFWEMHDILFESQHQLEHDDLVHHASRLGLDVERFGREMRDQLHLPAVRAHLESGLASGVTETPTFFIDGVKYVGSYGARDLISATRVSSPVADSGTYQEGPV